MIIVSRVSSIVPIYGHFMHMQDVSNPNGIKMSIDLILDLDEFYNTLSHFVMKMFTKLTVIACSKSRKKIN